MNKYIFILASITIISCNNGNVQKSYSFEIPKVLFNDTVRIEKTLFVSENTESNYAFFCGKYRIGESVTFDSHKIFYKDSIFMQNKINLDDFNSLDEFLDLDTDSFNVKADYSQDILFNWFATEPYNSYYPVFIQNESSKTKVLLGKDDRIFAIQEAKDEKGIWRPIESRGSDFCGVGYWGLKIQAGEFGVFLLSKYKGDFVTDIRARVKVGEDVYISNSFKGKIDKRQFLLKDITEMDKQNSRNDINYFFFGSIPLQLDTIVDDKK
jgi:hypothetical protein